ncbi:MAG: DUF1302 family protein [Pseudomonadota bacterium]
MKTMQSGERPRLSAMSGALLAACACGLFQVQPALAVEFETGSPDLKIRWDNTFKYTAAARLNEQSQKLINSPPISNNQDDGDRNFNRGLVSNRLDIFTEFDLSYQDAGLRVTGAGWYDQVYNQANDGNSPRSFNGYTTPYNRFSTAARVAHGRNAELLDAFVFGKADLGGMPLTFRAGNYSLLWGESLFFGNNGISGTQAALDIVRLTSVPNSLFKEVVLPDTQVSAQLALNSELSLGAYYKFSWRPNRFPVAGSYFASTDVIAGAERFFVGAPGANGTSPYLVRRTDLEAEGSGQGGLQLKWHPGEYDVGFYAIRFNDRNPSIYRYEGANANPSVGRVGEYNLAYNEHAKTFGISASRSFGDVVLSGEMSTRRDTQLLSDAQSIPAGTIANNNAPKYGVGNTAHVNLNWLWTLPPNAIAGESVLLGELAWNRRLSVKLNPNALALFSTRDAWGGRVSYTPTYRQALSGLDLSVPFSISYFPKGKSSAVAGFGVDKGGDMSLGIEATYLDTWRASLSATHFYGPENTFLTASPKGGATFSLQQSLKDRDFIALSIRRTF